MSLVYNFAFPPPAAVETVTVTDDGGTEVGSGALGSTVGPDGAITFQIELAEGGYTGTVEGSFGTWTTRGLLDLPDSIETGGVGASETAYFVATGPVFTTTDGAGGPMLVFVADDRHDALPSWVSLVDGNPTLNGDAGTCAFAIAAAFEFDFTGASAISDAPGIISVGGITVTLDGAEILNVSEVTKPGDGTDVQTTETIKGGGLLIGESLAVAPFPFASDDAEAPITDAAATPKVALTITRIAQAAVLPD